MSQIDALRLVEMTRQRLVDLAVSENYLRNSALADAAAEIWRGRGADGGLVSELWVQGAFPSELSNDTLESLAAEKLFPPELCQYLDRPDKFPAKRELFLHQAKAFRHAAGQQPEGQPSLVITAGTGAGKTEAFLLPILAGLWKNTRPATARGMRCLIVYPMNALVTDQVTRLYNLLKDQTNLSLFHFTSETPESDRNVKAEEKWEQCRPWSRQAARAEIPDIVITNYSMLEYMLCRPQDRDFFGSALRYIVLDEAHLYKGTLAAEITLLLRRVRDRCGVSSTDITQIATSATLGGSRNDLEEFAATLFSIPVKLVEVFEGSKAPLLASVEIASTATIDTRVLAQYVGIDIVTLDADESFAPPNQEAFNLMKKIILHLLPSELVSRATQDSNGILARFLKLCLEQIPQVSRLAKLVHENDLLSIDELTNQLWGAKDEPDRQATILLLRMAAAARLNPKDFPLIPHRLHFLVRAPQGLAACLNHACSTNHPELIVEGCGRLQPLRDRCVDCNSITLPVHRCKACGQWALAGHENTEDGVLESGYFAEPSRRKYYLVVDSGDKGLSSVIVNPETGEYPGKGAGTRLFRAACPEHGTTCDDPSQCNQQLCPHCGTSWTSSKDENDDEWDLHIQPLKGAERFALGVATETVLYGMPVYPDISRKWKPAQGRRLLCFSDSRREAARLGPLLSAQHETWVIRSIISSTLAKHQPPSANYLNRKILQFEVDAADSSLTEHDRKESARRVVELRAKLAESESGILFSEFARAVSDDDHISEVLDREAAEKHGEWRQDLWKDNRKSVSAHVEALIAKELDNPLHTAISTEAAGLLELFYPGLKGLQVPAIFIGLNDKVRSKLDSAWPEILAALLDTIRADRAVNWSKEEPGRTWNGESPFYRTRWCTRSKNGWTARRFIGADENRNNIQLRLWFARNVIAQAGGDQSLANHLLDTAFGQLFEGAKQGRLPWLTFNETHEISRSEQDQAIQIFLDRLRLRVPEKLYRCPETGTLWPRTILGWVPLKGCLGNLQELSHEEADNDRRWRRARKELREFPIFSMGLWGEEHSAQLSPEENKRRQFLFRDGARNLLSSTTTMELGIDIGGLNGVVLGNVPPGRANHMQRAGRAGRRSDGSSIVMTFAKNKAFDREVFLKFRDFLQQPLPRPLVLPFLNRPRFVKRHLHAMLLSDFFTNLQQGPTGAMDAYSNMGKLCGGDAPAKWENSAKPECSFSMPGYADDFVNSLEQVQSSNNGFRERSRKIVQNTPLEHIVDADDQWREFFAETALEFRKVCEDWEKDYWSLRDAWIEIPKTATSDGAEKAKANSIRYQMEAVCNLRVIEWFSDAGFLPRYGFPIHLQRLSVRRPSGTRSEKSTASEIYRLERSSMLALNEYVPGAQVLVGGKIVESSGILKHWTESNRDEALGLNYWALRCENRHDYLAKSPDEPCKTCKQPPYGKKLELMFPRFGYTTAAWNPPKQAGRNLDRVGEVKLSTASEFTLSAATHKNSNFGNLPGLMATYYEAGEGELLIRNAGGEAWSKEGHGFAVCWRCGFAMSEENEKPQNNKKQPPLPKKFKDHPSIFSSNENSRCWKDLQNEPVLRHKVLAAKETTDILILDWPGDWPDEKEGLLFSLGRALLLAGARMLELDSRELGLELKARESNELSILLYDTLPGGAGHCFELFNLGRAWMLEARKILRGSPEHDEDCRRACLECLLDFGGQFHAKRLDRRGALDLLDEALGDS